MWKSKGTANSGARRRLATAAILLAVGTSLFTAAPAMAADPGCKVTIQSANFVTNTDGRFLSVQAKVYCANVANYSYNSTQAGISIMRGGTNLTLQPNGANTLPAPLGQSRNCKGTNTCVIYVSARDTSGTSTYKIHAWGTAAGPSYDDFRVGATADRSVSG